MAQESPTAPAVTASKRGHDTMAGNDSDDEKDADLGLAVVATNQNIVAATKRYADKKRLRTDQATKLVQFAKDPPTLREIKLLANIFAFSNELGKLVASKPSYEVSVDLNTNMAKYAIAILLSSYITTYKGDAATDALMVVVKKLRFDLPLGLENIPSD
ncbi:hypothetical protein B0H19DRAFT_1186630 [Mycena capillaripes]|nr:hypothetical protein B0H19DRAFT_1186630 [Mycena capillaripes]